MGLKSRLHGVACRVYELGGQLDEYMVSRVAAASRGRPCISNKAAVLSRIASSSTCSSAAPLAISSASCHHIRVLLLPSLSSLGMMVGWTDGWMNTVYRICMHLCVHLGTVHAVCLSVYIRAVHASYSAPPSHPVASTCPGCDAHPAGPVPPPDSAESHLPTCAVPPAFASAGPRPRRADRHGNALRRCFLRPRCHAAPHRTSPRHPHHRRGAPAAWIIHRPLPGSGPRPDSRGRALERAPAPTFPPF